MVLSFVDDLILPTFRLIQGTFREAEVTVNLFETKFQCTLSYCVCAYPRTKYASLGYLLPLNPELFDDETLPIIGHLRLLKSPQKCILN